MLKFLAACSRSKGKDKPKKSHKYPKQTWKDSSSLIIGDVRQYSIWRNPATVGAFESNVRE